MDSNNKFNQGGYIRSYLIVAIVGLILLSFTIIFVKNRAEQARRDQAIAIVDEQENQEVKEETEAEPVAGNDESEPVVTQEPEEVQPTVVEDSSELPRTGPADTYQIFMLSILVGLFVAWLRSRSILNQPL